METIEFKVKIGTEEQAERFLEYVQELEEECILEEISIQRV